MQVKSNFKLENTLFAKDLYSFSKKETLTLFFQPLRTVDSDRLQKYYESKTKLTAEHKDMLSLMFGTKAMLDNFGERNEELPDETLNFEEHTNQLHHTGTIELNISETGKEEESKTFYYKPYTYTTIPAISTSLNFIFYKEEEFYAIQPSIFLSQLRSVCFDQKKKTYNSEALDELFKSLNSNIYDEDGLNLLEEMSWKCSKVSLSRVLIGLLPELDMPEITKLTDFLKSEMLAVKDIQKISENVFELRGETITYFYNSKNYVYPEEGTLGNSCMRGNGNTEQVRFYALNPTNVGLLTYIEDKRLLARAVLWTNLNGKKFIDRIYCASNKHGTKLAAYCKRNGYKTVYSSTASEYGLEHSRDCIVKLDDFELKGYNNYPYLDTMHWIDVINNLLCPDEGVLMRELRISNKDFLITNINYAGGVGNCPNNQIRIRRNNNEQSKYLRNIQGDEISQGLHRYALINKPKFGITHKDNIIVINENEKVDVEWCENTLIKQHNSLRPTLTYNTNNSIQTRYLLKYMDKQFVVYSTYHQFFIPIKESVYIPAIKSYIFKREQKTNIFLSNIRLIRLKHKYGGRLVRITPEGLESIKTQTAIFPHKESLMDIRKSRVYNVSVKNVFITGIRIKGIIVPFKHLRFVKK